MGKKNYIILACAAASLFVLYVYGLSTNPPGFYTDESSIGYNAYLISRNGADEFGARWPVYFYSLGDYKSPVFIYLLALVFKFTGPGILAARVTSATLCYIASLLMGLLSYRITGKRSIGIVIAMAALTTPWLYELSRLVFEVSFTPLALVLFLLALHRAGGKEAWSLTDAFILSLTLALVTYSYAVGRLLGPLLALGLLFFLLKKRISGVLAAWFFYALSLIPMIVYNSNTHGGLTARFNKITYINSSGTLSGVALQFLSHYAKNIDPLNFLLYGDTNLRHHIVGMGSMLAPVLALSLAGVVIVLLRYRKDSWWRFAMYGLVISPVPASLTNDVSHALRLIALPVFLLLFMVPAALWLAEKSAGSSKWMYLTVLLVFLSLSQFIVFQWKYITKGPERVASFDGGYPGVLRVALNTGMRPVYVVDDNKVQYIHALWYGLLMGVPASAFVNEKGSEIPPAGALVVGNENAPPVKVNMLIDTGSFRSYIIQDSWEYHVIRGRHFDMMRDPDDAAIEYKAASRLKEAHTQAGPRFP